MILITTLILLWFRMNYKPYMALADMYLILALIGIVYFTLDFVVSLAASKNQMNPPPYTQIINTVTVEKNTIIGPIPFTVRVGSYAAIAFMCLMLVFWIGASETTIIGVPSFQIIDLGISGVIVVTIAMAIMEDFIFFGLVAPTISGLGRVMSMGNQLVGTGLSIIVTPLIFVLYHFLVYGASDLQASFFVGGFALVVTTYILTFRDILGVHALHITNNVTLKAAHAFGIAIGG